MAIRLFRIVVVSLALVLLGSCDVLQYIFGSVFPATLALAKAQADLSGDIDSGSGESFNVRVIEAGSNGYVVVEGTLPTEERAFFFYDLDLNLKRSLTLPSTGGNGVMVDAGTGNIDAGGTMLVPATLAAAVPATGIFISNSGAAGNDGFIASGSDITGFNFQSGSSILNYSVNGTQTSSPSLSSTMSNLQVDAVLDDGDSTAAGSVIIVLSQSGGNNNDDATRYFMRVLKTDFATALSAATNILDTAPHRDKLERDSLGFADGSIMAYDKGSSRYVRIDPANASTQKSLYSTSPSNTRFAYRIGGGEFYTFNTDSRILTKYVAWW